MSSLVLPNNNIENIKMVVFDKDGTLIDVHHYWCSMIEFRAKFFIESLKKEDIDLKKLHDDLINNMGINLTTKKMKPEGPVGIKPRNFIVEVALDTIKTYVGTYSKEKVTDIFQQVDEYSKTKLNEIVKPLQGVEKLLNSLKKHNYLISIATTDLSSRAVLAMKNLSLEKYFNYIAGADLVKNAKPNPDLVEYIMGKHDLSPEVVLVIGDSMADLKMAKNAKCNFLGVKTGLYTQEFINESQYLVDDLTYVEVL